MESKKAIDHVHQSVNPKFATRRLEAKPTTCLLLLAFTATVAVDTRTVNGFHGRPMDSIARRSACGSRHSVVAAVPRRMLGSRSLIKGLQRGTKMQWSLHVGSALVH